MDQDLTCLSAHTPARDTLEVMSSVDNEKGVRYVPADILSLSLGGVDIVTLIAANTTLESQFKSHVATGREEVHRVLVEQLRGELISGEGLSNSVEIGGETWQILSVATGGEVAGALGALVAVGVDRVWTDRDRGLLEAFAGVLTLVTNSMLRERGLLHQQRLDELVSQVAERLMCARSEDRHEVLTWTVKILAEFLDANVAFIRRNDHANGLSILETEWPPRPWEGPGEDPLGIVRFDSDPIFADTEFQKSPHFLGGNEEHDEYMDRIESGSGVATVAGASVPLLVGDVTWGVLAFMHFREHAWLASEVRALQAVASMLMQLQGRFDAEGLVLYNANHDDLTGLPNRRALVAKLDEQLSAKKQLAVMVIDLDRFKVMNDYLGHASGDKLLLTMADRLQLSVRVNDFAARLGGDEFVFLLSDVGSSMEAYAAAQRILEVLAAPAEIMGTIVNHTASIGVALSDGEGATSLDLLSQADVAMYAAKTRGRNQAVIFDEELRNQSDERNLTELLLSDSIENGGLRLHFQPEVDLISGKLVAVEALVRWQHPNRGLLSAAQFITIAEEAGLVVGIGRWVFEEMCRQLSVWEKEYPELRFAVRVNMSPADFKFDDLVSFVTKCIAIHNVDASRICIEITEHTVVSEAENTARILYQFRELGIEVAIDDFGTGFSSMTELKRLPVDFLKLDMSFVTGVINDRYDRAIVKSICQLAESLDLGVIGEGIESADIARELVELGCSHGQGYLISKPKSAEDLTEMLANGGVNTSLFSGAV